MSENQKHTRPLYPPPARDCKFLDCIWHEFCWNEDLRGPPMEGWEDTWETGMRCLGKEKCGHYYERKEDA